MVSGSRDTLRTSGETLALISAERPDDVAVIDRGETITFSRFYDDVRRTVPVLSEMGLSAGKIAAIQFDGLYRPWLLQIACESLGVATTHFDGSVSTAGIAPLVRHAAAVFQTSNEETAAAQHVVTDDAWWSNTLKRAPSALPPLTDTNSIVRIACSSGTTGSVKFIPQTAAHLAFRSHTYRRALGLGPASRYLVGLGFSVQLEQLLAATCLSDGATTVYAGPVSPGQAIRSTDPSHVTLLPVFIANLIENLDAKEAPHDLTICAIGGQVAKEVRDEIRSRFGFRIVESYATNETSIIAIMDENGTGDIVPGVSVQIVDDSNRVLPEGETGRIRVKSPGAPERYLFNESANNSRFENGWFYPGDLGRLLENGRLELLGRDDDLLNINGYKISAPAIERDFGAIAQIDDIAACLKAESGHLCIAVVAASGAASKDIIEQIEARLRPEYGTVSLRFVERIPRTATGKIQRRALATELGSGE